jgi:hypothetical protein
MGKRSAFKRRKNDLYRTPLDPIPALAAQLPARFRFAEPCAGNGVLADHLRGIGGTLAEAVDVMPARGDIRQGNALEWQLAQRAGRPVDFIITNPPWTRDLLHPMIEHFAAMAPTWLLFDADWAFTKQSAPFRLLWRRYVAVGRVKWIAGSKNTGKDNAAWYLFDANGAGYGQDVSFTGRWAA